MKFIVDDPNLLRTLHRALISAKFGLSDETSDLPASMHMVEMVEQIRDVMDELFKVDAFLSEEQKRWALASRHIVDSSSQPAVWDFCLKVATRLEGRQWPKDSHGQMSVAHVLFSPFKLSEDALHLFIEQVEDQLSSG